MVKLPNEPTEVLKNHGVASAPTRLKYHNNQFLANIQRIIEGLPKKRDARKRV